MLSPIRRPISHSQELCRMHPSEIYVGVLRTLDPHALRGLELSYFKSFDVLKHAMALFPCLTWLRIPARAYTYDWSGEWGELLYLLPEVEVLHGVSPFKDPSGTSVADNEDRAGELAAICPKVYRTKH